MSVPDIARNFRRRVQFVFFILAGVIDNHIIRLIRIFFLIYIYIHTYNHTIQNINT